MGSRTSLQPHNLHPQRHRRPRPLLLSAPRRTAHQHRRRRVQQSWPLLPGRRLRSLLLLAAPSSPPLPSSCPHPAWSPSSSAVTPKLLLSSAAVESRLAMGSSSSFPRRRRVPDTATLRTSLPRRTPPQTGNRAGGATDFSSSRYPMAAAAPSSPPDTGGGGRGLRLWSPRLGLPPAPPYSLQLAIPASRDDDSDKRLVEGAGACKERV